MKDFEVHLKILANWSKNYSHLLREISHFVEL